MARYPDRRKNSGHAEASFAEQKREFAEKDKECLISDAEFS